MCLAFMHHDSPVGIVVAESPATTGTSDQVRTVAGHQVASHRARSASRSLRHPGPQQEARLHAAGPLGSRTPGRQSSGSLSRQVAEAPGPQQEALHQAAIIAGHWYAGEPSHERHLQPGPHGSRTLGRQSSGSLSKQVAQASWSPAGSTAPCRWYAGEPSHERYLRPGPLGSRTPGRQSSGSLSRQGSPSTSGISDQVRTVAGHSIASHRARSASRSLRRPGPQQEARHQAAGPQESPATSAISDQVRMVAAHPVAGRRSSSLEPPFGELPFENPLAPTLCTPLPCW
nr:sperm acrosomal protein FSA-ACR.1-like [Dermacentor andersoni]